MKRPKHKHVRVKIMSGKQLVLVLDIGRKLRSQEGNKGGEDINIKYIGLFDQ